MALYEVYRNYFDIDPEYFPAVNEKIIEKNPDVWKKFYPHEAFVKLLKNTVDMLERKQKLCLWVEGAYGTGKSHAVLTLKRLLDSNEDDTYEYFREFNLDTDLYKRIQSAKTSGRILTVHRYGSSAIHGDHDLVFAIQESIENALIEAGIENKARGALKTAVINWLSDKSNKNYFDELISDKYRDWFGGDNVDAVIQNLNTYSGDALISLMDKIFKVADDRQIKAISMSTTDLANWIREAIKENNLKAIVFIWDEFTEYFRNNARHMTGFQELCEISGESPFYFILVTHATQGLFIESDQEFKKLNGRFISPHCKMELPSNIAFQLMGAALKKNKDPQVLKDWEMFSDDLADRTKKSRERVKEIAGISDKEMKNILPLHPYAALLLKYISSSFDSNQRSMFDFIKNDRGDEIKGFQWFIDTYGPDSDNLFFTVDMLWDFFYERGKDNLTHDVRSILDYFNRSSNQNLDSNQKCVLKTILLLMAISQNAGDAVDLFIPNDKNIDCAFDGTDLENSTSRIASSLVREKVLYEKTVSGKTQYAIYSHEPIDPTPYRKEIDQWSTTKLITENIEDKKAPNKLYVADAVTTTDALKLRYVLKCVSSSDFDLTIRQLRNTEDKYVNKIVAVVCFAKDDRESNVIGTKIDAAIKAGVYDMIFIDASRTPFGADGYENYCEAMALSMAQQKKDYDQANQYADDAKGYLKKWKKRIEDGEFVVYSADKPSGERVPTIDALYLMLKEIDKAIYPKCLECEYNVIGTMYTSSNLKQAVECACNQETKGTFKSNNSKTSLENALSGAWKVDEYWKSSPYLLISKIKLDVDELIEKKFKESERISISDIYDFLKSAQNGYGFLPCNLSAFMMGFVLKEYTNSVYSWTDGLTTETLSVEKLKDMISEVISLDITPNQRYRDKYIVSITREGKAFNEITSIAFGIPLNMCTAVTEVSQHIRDKMKGFSFPIWTLKSILRSEPVKTDASILEKLIDLFCGIANNKNIGGSKSENDISKTIGTIALEHPTAAEDLKSLFNKEKCREGMTAYLASFDDGELRSLAETVGDNGQYVSAVREKFDADAANWVWNVETAQQKIREVILEYRIIVKSNDVISKSFSYKETIQHWCEISNNIRISFDAGKNYFDELYDFLYFLYKLKKAGTLLDSQKEEIFNLLVSASSQFMVFYNSQIDVFKRICGYYLDGLNDEDIQKIFQSLPAGMFTYDRQEYITCIEKKVTAYKGSLKSERLKKLWKDKTNSESPRLWSKEHRMPILCLVPDSELAKARVAFSTINRSSSESNDVNKAMEYLETASFFESMHDENLLDVAFKKRIIKNYSVMLPDISEVKAYLEKVIPSDPYDWFENSVVEKHLKEMAEAKYCHDGYKQALSKIDTMSPEDVKSYLKRLIQNNMAVGIEIINDK
ncbi:MAG: hypothetical protein LUF29_02525 [Oscillospiraceae bacterium]|nr:hypothetical protein [Oscillospiraceae bacterium]